MGRLLSYAAGIVTGIWLDQTYKLPNVMTVWEKEIRPRIANFEKKDDEKK